MYVHVDIRKITTRCLVTYLVCSVGGDVMGWDVSHHNKRIRERDNKDQRTDENIVISPLSYVKDGLLIITIKFFYLGSLQFHHVLSLNRYILHKVSH